VAEKILIVDDDQDTLRLVGLLLQRKGYQVTTAETGYQALEIVGQDPPQLVLLDIMMPDLDGLEILRRLRANPGSHSLPVILFSAKSQVADKVSGLETGADDYLTKPTHPAELLARVRSILGRSVVTPPGEKPTPVPAKRGRLVGVLAARGGQGVTTVAVNTAAAHRLETQGSTLLAEFRPGVGALHRLLGLPNRSDLNDLLKADGKAISAESVGNLLVRDEIGLQVLLSSPKPSDADLIRAGDRFEKISDSLTHMADLVVIDLGPGLPAVTEKIVQKCDHVLVITEPIANSISQTRELLDELSMKVLGLSTLHVIQVQRFWAARMLGLAEIQEQLGRRVAMTIPPALELALEAEYRRRPLVMVEKSTNAAQHFFRLANLVTKPA